jgi:hypothetical protein
MLAVSRAAKLAAKSVGAVAKPAVSEIESLATKAARTEIAAGERAAKTVAQASERTGILPNADRIGYGFASAAAGGAAAYGTVRAVNRIDQYAAQLPMAIEGMGVPIGKAINDSVAGLGQLIHELEEGAEKAIGMPVSQGLQIAATVATVVGVGYVAYKVLR